MRRRDLRDPRTGHHFLLLLVDEQGRVSLAEGDVGAPGSLPGDAVGVPISESFGGLPALLEGVRKALAGEAAAALVPFDGTELEMHFEPRRDVSGEVVGCTVLGIEVTRPLEKSRRRACATSRAPPGRPISTS